MQEKDKNGLVKTGEYTAVNPNFQAPVNPRVAAINAQIAAQGNKGYSVAPGTTDSQGKLIAGSQPITSASLSNSETPLTIPQINQSSASSGLSAISSSVVPQTREATKIEQETQKKAEEEKGFLSRQKEKIQGLMQSVIGVQQSQAGLETEAKIGEKTQKVTDVTNQIEALDRAETNELRALDTANMTAAGSQAAQAGIRRKYAFEKADLALIQSAANRDLLTAQSIVDRKIQLQLEPLKQQLEFETMFYDENRDAFTKAEDRAFQAKISADERSYDEAKTLQETIGKLQIQAASQGADPSIIQAIGRSKSMSEAIQNAGQYAGDVLDRQYKQAQIANINSQIAERNATGTGMESSNLLAYAQQYASTGVIPTGLPKGTFGAVAQTAKELPKQNGTVVNSTTGIADAKTPATEQADYARLYNILNNVKRLKELDEERIGGIVSGTLGKVFGAEKQSEYLATRKAIVDDMQRMQSGAALTPAETSFYEGYLPGRFSEPLGLGQDSAKKIGNFETIITNRLNERLSTNGLSIYGYSKIKTSAGDFTVGDVIEVNGVMGRINPDGSVTKLSQ